MKQKYVIEIEKPVSCQSCELFGLDSWGNVGECKLNKEICFQDFAYYKEISYDCPLINWIESK